MLHIQLSRRHTVRNRQERKEGQGGKDPWIRVHNPFGCIQMLLFNPAPKTSTSSSVSRYSLIPKLFTNFSHRIANIYTFPIANSPHHNVCSRRSPVPSP